MSTVYLHHKNKRVIALLEGSLFGLYAKANLFKLDEKGGAIPRISKLSREEIFPLDYKCQSILKTKRPTMEYKKRDYYTYHDVFWWLKAERIFPASELFRFTREYQGFAIEWNWCSKPFITRVWGGNSDLNKRSVGILLYSVYSDETPRWTTHYNAEEEFATV